MCTPTPYTIHKKTTNPRLSHANQQKTRAKLMGKPSVETSLDQSHPMADIRLQTSKFKTTRQDLNGGFITEFVRGMSVSRYTTRPIYSDKGDLRWMYRLDGRCWVRIGR
jgi:hypothetical protein